jgi:ketosteroid isomerase-like protein
LEVRLRNIDVATAFVSAINAHDVGQIANLASEDHEFIDSSGRSICGREAVCAAWRGYFAFCPDYWVKADEVIGGANCVALFGAAGGTIIEAGCRYAANEWRIPAAWRAVIRQDLMECWQVYADIKPVYDIVDRLQPSGRDG